jgi:hypothetical protein
MTNHQLIINPLFVIINLLASFAYLSPELLSETLLPIWPAGESSTNRQLISLNRKPGGRIYRQSIDGEETNAPDSGPLRAAM